MSIKNILNNINFDKVVKLPKNNDEIILKIHHVLKNLPCLNILYNKKLLEETIEISKQFAKNKSSFLIFGTGGSNLGSKALINILQSSETIDMHFFDNIDPIQFKNVIEKIDLLNAGIIIISKSGSTPETLSQFASIIEIFEQKNCSEILYERCLVITENKRSPLSDIANKNNCKILNHEKDIGGRFSVFSNVGMVPAIIAGIDVKKVHQGALQQIDALGQDEYLKMGQFFCHQNFNKQLNTSVIMTYSDALYYFGKWYLQLWAESLGKDNKGITAIHSVGTTDQHSQLQLYLDGPKDKIFTFITTQHSKLGYNLNKKTMVDHKIDYLINKTMGDLMQAEQEATIETFKSKNLLFREIFFEKIDEISIGKLMAFSIMETVATCLYYNVDPFNQPAVEYGKLLTKKILS